VARLPKRKPVAMRVARAQKVIGIPVPAKEMAGVFKRLGFGFSSKKNAFTVNPPSYRFDIAIEEDLIEEVARVYGFERIAAHPPRVAATMLRTEEGRRSVHALRERLAAADYREVINFSFVEPAWEADFAGQANPIRLLNPIVSQQSVMRTSLIGSLVDVVKKNITSAKSRASACSRPAACTCATRRRRTGRSRSAGCASRCASRPPPTGRPLPSSGTCRRARWTSTT
jgi:phenylalanyl-tRNA synthetase beta chain